jgi:ribosomal 30S subunit maturation factor RimM
LVHTPFNILGFRGKRDKVSEIVTRQIGDLWQVRGPRSYDVAVYIPAKSQAVADPVSLEHLNINIDLKIPREL